MCWWICGFGKSVSTEEKPIIKVQCLKSIPFPITQLNDNKVDVAAAVELAKTALGDNDPRVASAQKVAQACSTVTDPDRCEAAAKIFACSIEEGKKNGFDFAVL